MLFPVPTLILTPALASFAIIAVSMIGITVFLLGKVLPANGTPPLVTQMVLALAVLGGGSVLLTSLLFVFLNPNGTEAWTFVLLAFNFMMMFPAGVWFIGLILFRDRRIDPTGWFWSVAVALITTSTEALMGVVFAYAAVGGPTPTVPALAVGLSSLWFFWSMACVMVALLVWAPLRGVERGGLLMLTLAAILGPWVTSFPLGGGIAMAALMGTGLGLLVRAVLRGRVAPSEGRLLVGLAAAFLVMAMSGVAVAVSNGRVEADLVFGSAMGFVMGIEVAYLVRRYYQGEMGRPWLARPVDEDDLAAAGSAAPSAASVLSPGSPDAPALSR